MQDSEAVVLDIEGTVCPITFVHDVLFPYALKRSESEIPRLEFPLYGSRSELESYLLNFPPEYTKSADTLLGHIQDLIKNDVKAGYLKSLQGYLWKDGYESGEIKAPIYADAVEAIKKWSHSTRVYIYSSGSVPAQKLLFAHTDAGDLRKYLSAYFDTLNAGPKFEPSSYEKIAANTKEQKLRFFSDNPKEIDAAASAGWATTFVVRPGNPEFPGYKYPDEKASTFQ